MKKTKLLVLFLAFIFITLESKSQGTPLIYWDTVYAASGTDVISTLHFKNMPDLGSVSLTAFYKMSKLTFINGTSIFPTMVFNSVLNIGAPGIPYPGYGAILLGYYSLTPLSFSEDQNILKVKFHVLQDSAKIDFDDFNNGALEVSDVNGNVIPCINSPGYVLHGPVITGTLTYSNAVSTPLDNCIVLLKQNGVAVSQDTTTASGNYRFDDFPLGNYMVEPKPVMPWGGGTSVDALMIIKHFAGIVTLTGMSLMAADVNGDAAINTADAVLVAKRFVNQINSFPASDWIVETPAVNVTTPGLFIVNLKGVCRGDVNGSYIP